MVKNMIGFIRQEIPCNRKAAVIHGEEGFSLIGALMGLAIFLIGVLAVLSMQTSAIGSIGISQKYTQANSWAQDQMETLLSLPYDDPLLEPVKGDDGSVGGGMIHTATQGSYTLSWAVFTADNNGENINSFAAIRDEQLFDDIDKAQNLQDIPENLKVISLQAAHPLGQNSHLVFLKANL
jgi:hypothetical protein